MDIFAEYAKKVEDFRKKLPEAGELFARELRDELSGTGGPSSPGTPPHTQTGRLANSFSVVADGEGKVKVVSGCDYALMVNDGTSKMAPRPYVAEALGNALNKIKDLIES